MKTVTVADLKDLREVKMKATSKLVKKINNAYSQNLPTVSTTIDVYINNIGKFTWSGVNDYTWFIDKPYEEVNLVDAEPKQYTIADLKDLREVKFMVSVSLGKMIDAMYDDCLTHDKYTPFYIFINENGDFTWSHGYEKDHYDDKPYEEIKVIEAKQYTIADLKDLKDVKFLTTLAQRQAIAKHYPDIFVPQIDVNFLVSDSCCLFLYDDKSLRWDRPFSYVDDTGCTQIELVESTTLPVLFKSQQDVMTFLVNGGTVIDVHDTIVSFVNGKLTSSYYFTEYQNWKPYVKPNWYETTTGYRACWVSNTNENPSADSNHSVQIVKYDSDTKKFVTNRSPDCNQWDYATPLTKEELNKFLYIED